MSFSPEEVQSVWERGQIIQNYDPTEWRKDICNAWIHRGYYGRTDNIYGWEIDHVVPESRGGTDDISNLRPLQWENNREKASGRTDCAITSQGKQNVRR